MIYENHIIPRHERSAFDVIADACWCTLSILERHYPCFRSMYGDPEYPEDGPEPRSNENVKKLGCSENPEDVMRCIINVLNDGIKSAKDYDLSDMTETDFVKWRNDGYNINEEWNKTT